MAFSHPLHRLRHGASWLRRQAGLRVAPLVRWATPLLAAPVLGALVAAGPAPAQSLSISPLLRGITPGSVGGDPSFSGSLGYRFTLSQPTAVSALGFYDDQDDGLLSSHSVGLFEDATQTQLLNAVVPAGNGTTLLGGFRWIPVPLQILNPGNYVLAATSSGDPALFDPFLFDGFDPIEAEGFQLGSLSLTGVGSGSVVRFPDTDEGRPLGFFGPNLAAPAPAPGPLPVLGAAGALAWSRRLRRRVAHSQPD